MGFQPDPDRLLPSRRHEKGRIHLAGVVNWWLGRSKLSHDQVAAIVLWALREPGSLGSSQLSHLRNARIFRPGLIMFEGLAALNAAIWRWQVKGQEACLDAYGPYSAHGIDPAWLDDAVWLPHPDHPDEPLCFADFCEIFCGYLTIPEVGVRLTAVDGPDLSRRLSALLLEHWQAAGWGPTEGIPAILAAYPSDDQDRRQRLSLVVLGQADFSSEELEEEMPELAAMVAALRQQPPEGYGPVDLQAELASARRRA